MTSTAIDYTVDPRIESKGKLTEHVRETFLTGLIYAHPMFAEAMVLNFNTTRDYLPQLSPLTRRIKGSGPIKYLERDDERTDAVGLVKDTIKEMGGKLVGSVIRASRFAAAEFVYHGWHLAVWVVVAPDEYMEGELTSRVRVTVLNDRAL